MPSTDPRSARGARTVRRVRDADRTRAAVLDATERVFAARGARASLAEVAAEAGVTKSGLLHHFPSRAVLVEALVRHVLDRVWAEVEALVEPGDARPGRFARAYVRASTGDSDYLREVFGASGMLARFGEEVAATFERVHLVADAERWDAAFAADGLPPGRAAAVRYAADGVLMALGTPYLRDDRLTVVRAELLALTDP